MMGQKTPLNGVLITIYRTPILACGLLFAALHLRRVSALSPMIPCQRPKRRPGPNPGAFAGPVGLARVRVDAFKMSKYDDSGF
jgi:hypothetical protein